MDEAPTALGSRVRAARRAARLTQAQLAGSRLSESYISLIEAGRRRPTPDALDWIAERLGVPVEQLRGPGPAEDTAELELAIRRGEIEASSGQAERACERLRAAALAAADRQQAGLARRAQAALARTLETTGRLAQARAVWEEVLAASRAEPRHGLEAAATVGICRCAREAGDLEGAIEVGEAYWRSITSPGQAPEPTEDVVVVGATLLCAYLETGGLRRARELADQLTALADRLGTPLTVGAAYWNAALTAENEGRVAEALALAERAAASFAQTDDVRNRARLQTALGGLHLRSQPPDATTALGLLLDAEPVLRQFAGVVDVAYCRTEVARAHLILGDARAAAEVAAETVTALEQAGGGQLQHARALMILATAQARLDQPAAALTAARQAAVDLGAAGATRPAAEAWTVLAELCAQLGQTADALDAYRQATKLFGAPPGSVARPGDDVDGGAARAANA